jgi:hypothetical protein
MKSIKPPTALLGMTLAVIWILLSLTLSFWLYELDGFRSYSIILMVSCAFAGPTGAEFNDYRRGRFAREHGLTVCYSPNVFGNGKFFSGYRNKAGKYSYDGSEFIE